MTLDQNMTTLTTRSGFVFHVRAAQPNDQSAIADFFTHVEKDDLRFRFLTAVNTVAPHLIASFANVDHTHTENILAFDTNGRTIIASAMLSADPDGERAEVAMAIRADFKRKGISWTLLEHVARMAKGKGIRTLESIEAHDHHEAIEMEREMGFLASPYPGDATLVLLQAKLGT